MTIFQCEQLWASCWDDYQAESVRATCCVVTSCWAAAGVHSSNLQLLFKWGKQKNTRQTKIWWAPHLHVSPPKKKKSIMHDLSHERTAELRVTFSLPALSLSVFVTVSRPAVIWMRRIFSVLQDKDLCRNLGHSLTPCWHHVICPAPSHSARGSQEIRARLFSLQALPKICLARWRSLREKTSQRLQTCRSAQSGPIRNKYVTLCSVFTPSCINLNGRTKRERRIICQKQISGVRT